MQDCYKNMLERLPFTVAGVELAPLTLGHFYILDATGFDFNKKMGKDDLFHALFFCRYKSWRNAMPYSSAELNAFAMDIAHKMTDEDINEFLRYVNYYTAHPKRFDDPNEGGAEVPIPWHIYTAFLLVRFMGISREEAFDMPCCEAFVWRACAAVYSGAGKFLSDYDSMIEEAVERGEIKVKTQDEIKRAMFGEGK